jgi:hypothetical protein
MNRYVRVKVEILASDEEDFGKNIEFKVITDSEPKDIEDVIASSLHGLGCSVYGNKSYKTMNHSPCNLYSPKDPMEVLDPELWCSIF